MKDCFWNGNLADTLAPNIYIYLYARLAKNGSALCFRARHAQQQAQHMNYMYTERRRNRPLIIMFTNFFYRCLLCAASLASAAFIFSHSLRCLLSASSSDAFSVYADRLQLLRECIIAHKSDTFFYVVF